MFKISGLVACLLFAYSVHAFACSVAGIDTPSQLVSEADGIYRVVVRSYVNPQSESLPRRREINPLIRFEVIETLKGNMLWELQLHGILTQTDDFNDGPVPYTFVRSSGRHGSCVASEYQQGSEYLLIMKNGDLDWSPLAPINEQIKGSADPWLAWVRLQIAMRASNP